MSVSADDPNENVWYSTTGELFVIPASDLAEGKFSQRRQLNETLGLSGGFY
jgi:hypothetical protein